MAAGHSIPPDVLLAPAFHACCSAATGEFYAAVLRLKGLPPPARTPLDAVIDAHTGASDAIGRALVTAVYDLIYLRLPPEVLADLRGSPRPQAE